MAPSTDDHFDPTPPKRILSLDGGGIRGVLSLQILRRLEEIFGSPLSDSFDLIGGTSTGSIIATGLALGWSVEQLQEMYRELGHVVFRRHPLRIGFLKPKFPREPLERALSDAFGDTRLGDDAVRTGLAIVCKRLDTGSPWVLHNHPRGKFFESEDPAAHVPNRAYRLRELVRASTAAPYYFDPEPVEVAEGEVGLFIDGGVSPHDNPALQLLLLATLEGYGYGWPMGEEDLLLVSVGTGAWNRPEGEASLIERSAGVHAVRALASMMVDASILNRLLLQWLSRSPTAEKIDSEIGDLSGDHLGDRTWLTYVRYDADLDDPGLEAGPNGEPIDSKALAKLREIDRVENMELLEEIGRVAAQGVRRDHFPEVFLPDRS
jgi:hypothetical protein